MNMIRLRSGLAAFAGAFALLASGTSSAGYSASAIPFGFVDISATGTVIGGLTNQDDASVSIPIGFTFNFFGAPQTTVFVSSNGLLTFGSANSTFTNADLTTSPSEAAIAPFWDDLFADGRVLFQVFGPPGNATLVVQWDNVRFFSGGTNGDTLTFEALLFENGDIRFNYLDLVSGIAAGNNGGSATVGLKDSGTQGPDRLLLAFNNGPNAFVGSGQSTLLTPSRVPEPATLALLGLGLAGLVAPRKRARA